MYRYYCEDENFEPTTQTCSVPAWLPDSGTLPPLTEADAYIVAFKIGALWAFAWTIRQLMKSFRQ